MGGTLARSRGKDCGCLERFCPAPAAASVAQTLDKWLAASHDRGTEYKMMSATRQKPIPSRDFCPCAGATLDKLIQPAILSVLADGPMHGYRLAEWIGKTPMFGGRRPDVSGVYRFLIAMQRRGL